MIELAAETTARSNETNLSGMIELETETTAR